VAAQGHREQGLRRVSIVLPDEVYQLLEEAARRTGVSNRSRLISDAVVGHYSSFIDEEGFYAGALVLFYDHSRGETVYAVVDAQHGFEDVVRSSVHMHVSEEKCVEVLAVEGRGERILGLIAALRRVSGVVSVQHSLVRVR
jgi:CopG family nickel-responsive transcriptional regulator